MEKKKDLAITLRCVPYEERHRIVTALTEQHGRLTAMAMNAVQSRRFGGALDLFSASEWIFVERPGAELVRVEEATIRRSYEGIRKNFERFAIASLFNELLLKIAPERQPCVELFKLHSNALAALEELPEIGLPLINGYFAKLLQLSGNQPQIQECLNCRTNLEFLEPKFNLTCLIKDAGWICHKCKTQSTRHVRDTEEQAFEHSCINVTPAAIYDLQNSLMTPIRQVNSASKASKEEHQDLFKFLEALFIYHVPGFDRTRLKSLRFLDLESKWPLPSTNQHKNQPLQP